MRYEELITELCEVIKETEIDSERIFDNTDEISKIIDNIKIPLHKREKLKDLLSNIYGLLQRQDLHRQKIERVVNFVCDKCFVPNPMQRYNNFLTLPNFFSFFFTFCKSFFYCNLFRCF